MALQHWDRRTTIWGIGTLAVVVFAGVIAWLSVLYG